jgi:large subunit ribosomal protein L19e
MRTKRPHACGAFAYATRCPQAREKTIADQYESRRAKNKATRERKLGRREERQAAGAPEEAKKK